MKKILAFLLSVIMVMSMGVFSFSAQEKSSENTTGIWATSDEASKDEDAPDEPTFDEATFDEAALRQLVWEYMLSQMGGVNRFEGEHYNGEKYSVAHSIDIIYAHFGKDVGYAVFDVNFGEEEFDIGDCSVKLGDRVYTNEVNYYMVSSYLGLGYYVVIPEKNEVFLLEEAIKSELEGLRDWCDKEGIARKIGDADADGEITIKDATYIQKFIAGMEGYTKDDIYASCCSAYSDFDGDYKVNVKDVTNIQKYLAGLSFNYCENEGVTCTDIPEDAEKLDCDIKSRDNFYGFETPEKIVNIKNAEEYFKVFGKESDVYTEDFFESKNLVAVNRIFGSGSIGYVANGLYKNGNTLYVDCTIIDVKPGCAATCDMAYRGRFFEVSKNLTEGIENIFLFEDVRFDADLPIF